MRLWSRKIVAVAVLFLGCPLYVFLAISFIDAMGINDMPTAVGIVVYAIIGTAWALPLKKVFLGLSAKKPIPPN